MLTTTTTEKDIISPYFRFGFCIHNVKQMDFPQVLWALTCVRTVGSFSVQCIKLLHAVELFFVGGVVAHLRDYCVIYACDLENTRNWSFVCIRNCIKHWPFGTVEGLFFQTTRRKLDTNGKFILHGGEMCKLWFDRGFRYNSMLISFQRMGKTRFSFQCNTN